MIRELSDSVRMSHNLENDRSRRIEVREV